jgi:hypothetical protein
MADEIHVGDVGTLFVLTISDDGAVVDLSTATTKTVVFELPNGDTLEKAAAFYTDGSDGILTYTSTSGDLSVAGLWHLQAHVVLYAGEWHSDVAEFTVYPNLGS